MKRALLMLAGWVVAGGAQAANIIIINSDGPGEGFNDPTVTLPVGGNPGTTLGAQRLYLFQTAAREWGALLKSDIIVRVNANFDPLACSTNSAVLGSAGATNSRTLVPLPPGAKSNTFYPEALAEALLGADKNAGAADIDATFNSAIDTGCFGNGKLFWYGVDPLVAVPGNRVALFPTLLHELGHGLGFASLACVSSGGCGATWPFGGFPNNIVDIWSYFQAGAGTTANTWNLLNDAQRQASMVSEGGAVTTDDLVWIGANVTTDFAAYGGSFTGTNAGHLKLYAPSTIEAGSSVSHWTKSASNPNLLMEPVLSTGLFNDVDLTYSLLRDIGWLTYPRDEIFPDNFEAH
jgi:hypothetical protein